MFARQSGLLKRFDGFQQKKTTARKNIQFFLKYTTFYVELVSFFCLEVLPWPTVFSHIRSRRRKNGESWKNWQKKAEKPSRKTE